MQYKRKGIDFCADPGCLSQEYGGEIGELRYCSEHIPDRVTEEEYQVALDYCALVATSQGVEFGIIPRVNPIPVRKELTMSTIGLYFGIGQEAANDLRARLNELLGRLGYATETSANTSRERRKPWSGGLPKGLIALDRGELAVVPMPAPGEVETIVRFLRRQAGAVHNGQFTLNFHDTPTNRALVTYAEALEEAVRRQENVVKEDTGATPRS